MNKLKSFIGTHRKKFVRSFEILTYATLVFLIASNYFTRQRLKQSENDLMKVSVMNDSARQYMIYEGYLYANQQTAIAFAEGVLKTDQKGYEVLKNTYIPLLKKQDSVHEVWKKTKKIETRVEKIIQKEKQK